MYYVCMYVDRRPSFSADRYCWVLIALYRLSVLVFIVGVDCRSLFLVVDFCESVVSAVDCRCPGERITKIHNYVINLSSLRVFVKNEIK
jgi:hypothetical protein